MSVDPDIAAILPMLAGAPPLSAGTADSARAGFRLFTVDLRDPATLEPVKSVEDTTYPTANGDRKARIYRPDVNGPVPTILFIHGGGFVIGDIDTHDDQTRLLANAVGAVVYSIDYRLAPEHPFPAGYEDCIDALKHVSSIVATLGGDATRLAVAGDSAGGNLSAATAIAARDLGITLKAQLLIYPGTDFAEDGDYASRITNGEGYFLTAEDMLWFREQYAPVDDDPRASVAKADLENLAPAIVATAEYDPLCDEGEAYANLLEKAGVQVKTTRYAGMIHGFFGLGHLSKGARTANAEICADLKALLG